MFKNKNKLRFFHKTTLTVILTGCLFLSFPNKTQAALWPGIDPGINRVLDTAYDAILGILLGAAKQAAVKMLNSQVDSLVGGNNSTNSAAFITDWNDYLITRPQNDTRTYMNSYLTKMTGGRGSSSGYSSEGFSGSGNYANTLTQLAQRNLDRKNKIPKTTYEGNPSKMFDSGNFKNMSIFLSGINDAWSFNAAVDSAYEKKLAEQRFINQTKAISYQGFKGTTSGNGNTITYPGSLTKDMVANVENIPNTALASAKSIPEVITSAVSQLMTKLINQGFDSVQNGSQGQNTSKDKLDTGMNNYANQNGPSVWVNPDNNIAPLNNGI